MSLINNYPILNQNLINNNILDFEQFDSLNILDPNQGAITLDENNLLNFNSAQQNLEKQQIDTETDQVLTVFAKITNTITPNPYNTLYDNQMVKISSDFLSLYTDVSKTTLIPNFYVMVKTSSGIVWQQITNQSIVSVLWSQITQLPRLISQLATIFVYNNQFLAIDASGNLIMNDLYSYLTLTYYTKTMSDAKYQPILPVNSTGTRYLTANSSNILSWTDLSTVFQPLASVLTALTSAGLGTNSFILQTTGSSLQWFDLSSNFYTKTQANSLFQPLNARLTSFSGLSNPSTTSYLQITNTGVQSFVDLTTVFQPLNTKLTNFASLSPPSVNSVLQSTSTGALSWVVDSTFTPNALVNALNTQTSVNTSQLNVNADIGTSTSSYNIYCSNLIGNSIGLRSGTLFMCNTNFALSTSQILYTNFLQSSSGTNINVGNQLNCLGNISINPGQTLGTNLITSYTAGAQVTFTSGIYISGTKSVAFPAGTTNAWGQWNTGGSVWFSGFSGTTNVSLQIVGGNIYSSGAIAFYNSSKYIKNQIQIENQEIEEEIKNSLEKMQIKKYQYKKQLKCNREHGEKKYIGYFIEDAHDQYKLPYYYEIKSENMKLIFVDGKIKKSEVKNILDFDIEQVFKDGLIVTAQSEQFKSKDEEYKQFNFQQCQDDDYYQIFKDEKNDLQGFTIEINQFNLMSFGQDLDKIVQMQQAQIKYIYEEKKKQQEIIQSMSNIIYEQQQQMDQLQRKMERIEFLFEKMNEPKQKIKNVLIDSSDESDKLSQKSE